MTPTTARLFFAAASLTRAAAWRGIVPPGAAFVVWDILNQRRHDIALPVGDEALGLDLRFDRPGDLAPGRTVRVETALADELGLGASARIHTDRADAARVVEALQRRAGDAHVQLPAFDTLPLAAARTTRTTPLAYVRAWREHERVEPGGAPLLDPLVEVIQEGATLDVRVALLADGQLGVEVGLTWRRVQRLSVLVLHAELAARGR